MPIGPLVQPLRQRERKIILTKSHRKIFCHRRLIQKSQLHLLAQSTGQQATNDA